MRKWSAMYQASGGMDRHHKCSECGNLVKCGKVNKCKAYGITEGHDTDWPERVMACKFFGTAGPKIPLILQPKKPKRKAGLRVREDVVGQYCIYDYPDVLPRKECSA